ncbi:MAG TPA: 16S rRNA (adenine(1518)-N(6)/adenine(1519)-N(6))-dimethyltransferase RsmA [Bacillota bacterium]|nr:16S rRNA (adenine(1518)-N(6)/adenine(1519)-N(6))-dimethyltransferase RsmA [Bacillota bacterium]HOK69200.1 16S rRNA (adenine(1518)-N(6)/adenine(1519)-N(6))-dimethyltransferase RsmA [Bacillota bacterium]HPP84653.1 16S rRNA (adenine(1518)-N(6)/adenine(1519)-N(6))-dimethyltransferase RsmA [Bacillota bacterium]
MGTEFKKKKHYGQNFLINQAIPKRIAQESGITGVCGVIEIGPGFGVLTKELCAIAKKVVAVEIDSDLIPILAKNTEGIKNLKIIHQDILKLNIAELIAGEFHGMPVCVCANLPYYITTPIIMKLLEGRYGFESITVMVQKEVADRLCAKSGTPNYGAITAVINYYGSIKKLFTVSAGSFSPAPKVDSAVVKLDLYKEPPVFVKDEELFFSVIRASFSQRRKTIVNSLHSILNSRFTKQELCDIIIEIGQKQNVRGEELNIAHFAEISNRIYEKLHIKMEANYDTKSENQCLD